MSDEEYIQAAKAHYQELCEELGPVWRQVEGCGSFEAWFLVNDGPELRAELEGEEDGS